MGKGCVVGSDEEDTWFSSWFAFEMFNMQHEPRQLNQDKGRS